MTPAWSLGSGVLYWFAETNGSTKFVHENAESKLTEFQSERFGVFRRPNLSLLDLLAAPTWGEWKRFRNRTKRVAQVPARLSERSQSTT